LRHLLVGDGKGLTPSWRIVDEGESLDDDKSVLSLVTDGVVRVSRLHAPSFDAPRGALIGAQSLFDDREESGDQFAFDSAIAKRGPVELLQWPLVDLRAYLDENFHARRAFSILLASHACDTYLDTPQQQENDQASSPPEEGKTGSLDHV